VKPWRTMVDGVNGYDCSKDVKAKKEKSKLSKIEWKELTKARTLHYLKNLDQGAKLAAVMRKKLEEPPDKELDVGVIVPNCTTVNSDSQMTKALRVTAKYDKKKLSAESNHCFNFFTSQDRSQKSGRHSCIYRHEGKHSPWLVVPEKIITGRLELVEAMNARTALCALQGKNS